MITQIHHNKPKLGHYASFKLRKKIVSRLDARFHDYFMLDAEVKKVVLKQYY